MVFAEIWHFIYWCSYKIELLWKFLWNFVYNFHFSISWTSLGINVKFGKLTKQMVLLMPAKSGKIYIHGASGALLNPFSWGSYYFEPAWTLTFTAIFFFCLNLWFKPLEMVLMKLLSWESNAFSAIFQHFITKRWWEWVTKMSPGFFHWYSVCVKLSLAQRKRASPAWCLAARPCPGLKVA